MLGIPLISDYIHKVVKPQVVADRVDFLNYYATSLLLAMASLAISAKQYFGSPIQCWVPMEFRGGWEKYTEDYCFIQNSYYIPFEKQLPEEWDDRRDQISYYRWVPIMLALQALMFFAPNYFWNIIYKETAIQPQGIVKEAKKCSTLHGKNRELEIQNLAKYIKDTISIFSPNEGQTKGSTWSGRNATILYLLTKFFYLLNIVGQLVMLNHFFGGGYLHWGFQTVTDVIAGKEWTESTIFPRVIMCDFQVRRLGNLQRHTVQCVIMMNMINEKFYLFLMFWFIFVGICTLLNFFYYLVVMSVPRARARLILWNVNRRKWESLQIKRDDGKRFVEEFLHPDGVLLLKFISEHVSARVSRDLVNELIKIFVDESEASESKQSSSESSMEKPLLPSTKVNKNYYGNYEKNIKPYYTPRSAPPLPSQMVCSSLSGSGSESAPVIEDFIDGTLPIRSLVRARVAQQPNNNATGNDCGSPGSPSRQISPTEV
ncbi:unnamed protein product [Thelazia callipaeda]|uniref:Innexin n=1 Tax=Thelazia callipaeda TaxID=103827 RepID=A0A0N5CWC4_THECL|nr:unnamed protein product [Thelazia callipaeda]